MVVLWNLVVGLSLFLPLLFVMISFLLLLLVRLSIGGPLTNLINHLFLIFLNLLDWANLGVEVFYKLLSYWTFPDQFIHKLSIIPHTNLYLILHMFLHLFAYLTFYVSVCIKCCFSTDVWLHHFIVFFEALVLFFDLLKRCQLFVFSSDRLWLIGLAEFITRSNFLQNLYYQLRKTSVYLMAWWFVQELQKRSQRCLSLVQLKRRRWIRHIDHCRHRGWCFSGWSISSRRYHLLPQF